MIKWDAAAERYFFQTKELFGEIAPFGHYHGITNLFHKKRGGDAVAGGKALLNAEYYYDEHTVARGGSFDDRIYPRKTSEKKLVEHTSTKDSVTLRFPDTICPNDFKIEAELVYRIAGEDTFDLSIKAISAQESRRFELFIASYMADGAGRTFACACEGDQLKWHIFDKKGSPAANEKETFWYFRDDEARSSACDGRWNFLLDSFAPHFYKYPIIGALDDAGYALVIFADVHTCLYLGGQHHEKDTARDLSIGGHLHKGLPFHSRARLLCRKFSGNDKKALNQILGLYRDFQHHKA